MAFFEKKTSEKPEHPAEQFYRGNSVPSTRYPQRTGSGGETYVKVFDESKHTVRRTDLSITPKDIKKQWDHLEILKGALEEVQKDLGEKQYGVHDSVWNCLMPEEEQLYKIAETAIGDCAGEFQKIKERRVRLGDNYSLISEKDDQDKWVPKIESQIPDGRLADPNFFKQPSEEEQIENLVSLERAEDLKNKIFEIFFNELGPLITVMESPQLISKNIGWKDSMTLDLTKEGITFPLGLCYMNFRKNDRALFENKTIDFNGLNTKEIIKEKNKDGKTETKLFSINTLNRSEKQSLNLSEPQDNFKAFMITLRTKLEDGLFVMIKDAFEKQNLKCDKIKPSAVFYQEDGSMPKLRILFEISDIKRIEYMKYEPTTDRTEIVDDTNGVVNGNESDKPN